MTQEEKDVYKTAFELDQRWIVELAADRTPDICQSQSLNVFLAGDVWSIIVPDALALALMVAALAFAGRAAMRKSLE